MFHFDPEIWRPSDVVGWIIGIIASIIAVVFALRAEKNKQLIYEVTEPIALASVLPNTTERRLTILYERDGQEPLNVQAVYVRYIRVGNAGREAIRRDDIAAKDPLQIEMSGGRILDVAIEGVSQDVNNLNVFSVSEGAEEAVIGLDFDFLDYKDGALLRALSDSKTLNIVMFGTVIGMPGGIKQGSPGRVGSGRFNIQTLPSIFLIPSWIWFFHAISSAKPVDLMSNSWHMILQKFMAYNLCIVSLFVLLLWLTRHSRWPKSILLPDWFTEKSDRVWEGKRRNPQ